MWFLGIPDPDSHKGGITLSFSSSNKKKNISIGNIFSYETHIEITQYLPIIHNGSKINIVFIYSIVEIKNVTDKNKSYLPPLQSKPLFLSC